MQGPTFVSNKLSAPNVHMYLKMLAPSVLTSSSSTKIPMQRFIWGIWYNYAIPLLLGAAIQAGCPVHTFEIQGKQRQKI